MGRLTAGTTVLDVTVLDASSLSTPRRSIAHYPIGGGPPDVTLRAGTGLSGSLELLCADAATADAVYAAHLSGQVLRLDNWHRQNLVKDPRLTAAAWTPQGSTGTLTHATTGGPNGHGYFEYVLATATTSSPMQIPFTLSGLAAIPVVPGEPFIVSAYWWQSVNNNIQRFDAQWFNSAGQGMSTTQGTDLILPGEPSSTWYREGVVYTPPADAAFVRPIMSWSGNYNAGLTLRVADALVEYGTVFRPYFDGAMPGGSTLLNEWDGAANASVSRQYIRPALDLTYVCVDGGPEIPHRRGRHWLVRVSGVQEVAP